MTLGKRTQIYLSEELFGNLALLAKEEDKSIAAIIREACEMYLKKRRSSRDWNHDPLWNMVGKGESRDGDLSTHHDIYLYGTSGE